MSQGRRERQLDRLYASLPKVHCRGLCGREVCGPIAVAEIERRRIIDRAGERRQQTLMCPYLTADARCSVYDIRPLICRIWGAIDQPTMLCHHGCPVTPRPLTKPEARALVHEVERIAGSGTMLCWPEDAEGIRPFRLENTYWTPCSVCGDRAIHFRWGAEGRQSILIDARCPAHKF